MRDILFRGKRKDNGKWVYGFYFERDVNHHFIGDGEVPAQFFYPVIPETVSQLTGLTDKNGTNIFEGDIVRIKDYTYGVALNYEQPTKNYEVKWYADKAQFNIDYMTYLPYKDWDKCEVIGNIHDNPELLEV